MVKSTKGLAKFEKVYNAVEKSEIKKYGKGKEKYSAAAIARKVTKYKGPTTGKEANSIVSKILGKKKK